MIGQGVKQYRKGVILWVDDKFINNPPFENNVNVWQTLFGRESNRIFRFMDLELCIEDNLVDAIDLLDELSKEKEQGTFVFCILDMHLPEEVSRPEETAAINGLKLGVQTRLLDMPSVYLSTATDLHEELHAHGLDGIPFYTKLPGTIEFPDPLTHYLLSSFRNNISWISLEPILKKIDIYSVEGEVHALFETDSISLSLNYFPYFSSFRDFVERFEFASHLEKERVIVFRAPNEMTDAYILQCCLLAIGSAIYNNSNKKININYQYINNAKQLPRVEENSRHTINVYRACKETSKENFVNFLHTAQTLEEEHSIGYKFIIIPNDETAEEYIDEINYGKVRYEDLPYIHLGDTAMRKQMVNNALHLVFSLCETSGEMKEIHPFYTKNPHVLIHPKSWIELNESVQLAGKLPDSFSITDIIHKNFTENFIQQSHSSNYFTALANGLPIDVNELISFDFETVNIDEKKHLAEAFHSWLYHSWNSPYGLSVRTKNKEEWSEFSLQLLMDIVEKISTNTVKGDAKLAFDFLELKAIAKLTQNQSDSISNYLWNELLQYRWPHEQYPMPTALSKKLQMVGKTLWIENNHMSLAGSFISTMQSYNALNKQLNLAGQNLFWIKNVIQYLPIEWQDGIVKLTNWIENGQLGIMWANDHSRSEVCQVLLDFTHNVMPVVTVYSQFTKEETIAQRKEFWKKVNGAGIMLGKIKSTRYVLKQYFERSIYMENSSELDDITSFFELNDKVEKTYWKNAVIEKLKEKNCFQRILKSCTEATVEDLSFWVGKPVKIAEANSYIDSLDNEQINSLLIWLEKNFHKFNNKSIENIVDFSSYTSLLSKEMNRFSEICSLGKPFQETLQQFLTDLFPDEKQKSNVAHLFPFDTNTKKVDTLYKPDKIGFVEDNQDVFLSSLDAMSKLYQRIFFINKMDGYHLLDELRWLRNSSKGKLAPTLEEFPVNRVLLIGELFVIGFEAIALQLKQLLNMLGETEKADNIELHRMIMNDKTRTDIKLKELLNVIKNEDNSYNLYHPDPYDNKEDINMVYYEKGKVNKMHIE